jgi:hypothetical protein
MFETVFARLNCMGNIRITMHTEITNSCATCASETRRVMKYSYILKKYAYCDDLLLLHLKKQES